MVFIYTLVDEVFSFQDMLVSLDFCSSLFYKMVLVGWTLLWNVANKYTEL
jgi:hypothetical protein